MTLLTLSLLVNAVLHGIIIGRFGIRGNEPPALFGVAYAGLSLAAFLGWAHAPLAALIVTTVGLVGLAANFKKLQHDTTVEKFVFVVGAATVAYVGYSFLAR